MGLLPLNERFPNAARLPDQAHLFDNRLATIHPGYAWVHPAMRIAGQRMPMNLATSSDLPIPEEAPLYAGSAPLLQQASPDTGLFEKIGTSIANRPLTLMALGGGLAQGGIGRALTAAASAADLEQQRLNKMDAQRAASEALVKAGIPPELAAAAALRPDILKAISSEYFGGFKVVQTGEDAGGRKIFQLQGPGGKLYPIPQQIAAPNNPQRAL
jgi:hypothetical protein